jgi:putative endonuclease
VQVHSVNSVQANFMHNEVWYVYMLLCDQKTFYVGITTDLINRIKQHKDKKSFFTKKFSDVKLVYCERYRNKHQAAVREKQIKGWSRAKKQMLIKGKLGINTCTELVEALLVDENLL